MDRASDLPVLPQRDKPAVVAERLRAAWAREAAKRWGATTPVSVGAMDGYREGFPSERAACR
jgi:hypothetical protein